MKGVDSMNTRCFALATIAIIAVLFGCQKKEGIERLEQQIVSKVKRDGPHVAHLEAIYGLSFSNHSKRTVESDSFYIRKDMARVFYGYPLDEIEMTVVVEDDETIMRIKLPSPRQVSIDRETVSIKTTHDKYRPVDEDGKTIDIDDELMQELQGAIQRYESKTIEMSKNISKEYFETLSHRFGMRLEIEFSDQS
jgi:hypothetical protein